jgi:hypothetical protein
LNADTGLTLATLDAATDLITTTGEATRFNETLTVGNDAHLTSVGPVSVNNTANIGGDLTLSSGGLYTQNADVTIMGGAALATVGATLAANADLRAADLILDATSGNITMATGSTLTSTAGDIQLDADGNMVLTNLASSDDVIITAGGTVAHSGLVHTGNNLEISAGTNIAFNGSGTIDANLQVNAGGGILLTGSYRMGSGTITGAQITQSGTLLVNGDGSLALTADTSDIYMTGTTRVDGNGDVRYTAATDIYIGTIITGGQVSLTATSGTIQDTARDRQLNIIADGAHLVAGQNIGLGQWDALDMQVETFSALAGDNISLRLTTGGTVVQPSVRAQNASVIWMHVDSGVINFAPSASVESIGDGPIYFIYGVESTEFISEGLARSIMSRAEDLHTEPTETTATPPVTLLDELLNSYSPAMILDGLFPSSAPESLLDNLFAPTGEAPKRYNSTETDREGSALITGTIPVGRQPNILTSPGENRLYNWSMMTQQTFSAEQHRENSFDLEEARLYREPSGIDPIMEMPLVLLDQRPEPSLLEVFELERTAEELVVG